jgi:hypothetical protein
VSKLIIPSRFTVWKSAYIYFLLVFENPSLVSHLPCFKPEILNLFKNFFTFWRKVLSCGHKLCKFLAKKARDGPISIPNTRCYRYQGFVEKYRYWQEISIVPILLSFRYSFRFGQRTHHENDTKKPKYRRKYYKSSIFSIVLNGRRAESEFVVTLVTITDIYSYFN